MNDIEKAAKHKRYWVEEVNKWMGEPKDPEGLLLRASEPCLKNIMGDFRKGGTPHYEHRNDKSHFGNYGAGFFDFTYILYKQRPRPFHQLHELMEKSDWVGYWRLAKTVNQWMMNEYCGMRISIAIMYDYNQGWSISKENKRDKRAGAFPG